MPFEWLEKRGDKPLWELHDDTPLSLKIKESRSRLWEICQHSLFEEALLLLNPDLHGMYKQWGPLFVKDIRNSKVRQRERTLLRYLLRFCAKNDANAFFGATAAGSFDAIEPVDRERPVLSQRNVFITQWVVENLLASAKNALREKDVWVEYPVRAPAVEIGQNINRYEISEQDQTFFLKEKYESQLASQIIKLCNGKNNIKSIIDTVSKEQEEYKPGIKKEILYLFEKGFIQSVVSLPSGLVFPAEKAVEVLKMQPESNVRDVWIDRFSRLIEQVKLFQEDPFDRRKDCFYEIEQNITEWSNAASRRFAGEYHASRISIQEMDDRTGTPVGLAEGWKEKIVGSLSDYLELCRAFKVQTRTHFRDWFVNFIDNGAGPEKNTCPWKDIFKHYSDTFVKGDVPISDEIKSLASVTDNIKINLYNALMEHANADKLDEPLVINPEQIMHKINSVGDLLNNSGTAYCNSDIMIVDNKGEMTTVLSDSHHLPFLSGNLMVSLNSAPQMISSTSDFLTKLCKPAMPSLIWSYEHSFASVMPDLGVVALEVSGTAPYEESRRASIAEVQISFPDDKCHFHVPNYKGEMLSIVPLTRFMAFDLASVVFPVTVFDFCSLLGINTNDNPGHIPRIVFNNFVIQRAAWTVPSEILLGSATTHQSTVRIRKFCGDSFPRFTFIHSTREEKPILIDWADPISVEMVLWMAKRSAFLKFVEMYPEPDDLWLRSKMGRHTSELRTVFVRGAE